MKFLIFILISCSLCVFFDDEKETKKIQKQIVNPAVAVMTIQGHGSGTIIYKKEKDKTNRYYVLSVKHVIEDDFSNVLYRVDGLTGKRKYIKKDYPINIRVFLDEKEIGQFPVIRIAKYNDNKVELCMVVFESELDFDVANLAAEEVFRTIKRGKNVYLAHFPLMTSAGQYLTKGIISNMPKYNGLDYIFSDVNMAPGSSGSCLSIKHEDNYYCIALGTQVGSDEGQYITFFAEFESLKPYLDIINNVIKNDE